MNNKLITLHNKPTNRPSSLSTPPLPPSIETRRGRISQKTEKNTFSPDKKVLKNTDIWYIREKGGGIVGRFSRCSNRPMAVLDVSQGGRGGRGGSRFRRGASISAFICERGRNKRTSAGARWIISAQKMKVVRRYLLQAWSPPSDLPRPLFFPPSPSLSAPRALASTQFRLYRNFIGPFSLAERE